MPHPVTGELASLLYEIAAEVADTPGVEAVVLGGSRARGHARPDSDIDLGIYYASAERLDVTALACVAERLDDRHEPGLVTPVGGWGPWINGGGWLDIRDQRVDFLYRDLAKVSRTVEEAVAGRFEMVYQPGHPHGFPSYIYLGEVAICAPLSDKRGRIQALKAQAVPYPQALRRAIIDRFSWEADFSLQNAGKPAARGDAYYVAGCCFRSVSCLTQCLFALNNEYWLNEKGSVDLAAQFARAPERYAERVSAAFGRLRAEPAALTSALEELLGLTAEVGRLVSA
jgi:predicted nucleotidyltransferase